MHFPVIRSSALIFFGEGSSGIRGERTAQISDMNYRSYRDVPRIPGPTREMIHCRMPLVRTCPILEPSSQLPGLIVSPLIPSDFPLRQVQNFPTVARSRVQILRNRKHNYRHNTNDNYIISKGLNTIHNFGKILFASDERISRNETTFTYRTPRSPLYKFFFLISISEITGLQKVAPVRFFPFRIFRGSSPRRHPHPPRIFAGAPRVSRRGSCSRRTHEPFEVVRRELLGRRLSQPGKCPRRGSVARANHLKISPLPNWRKPGMKNKTNTFGNGEAPSACPHPPGGVGGTSREACGDRVGWKAHGPRFRRLHPQSVYPPCSKSALFTHQKPFRNMMPITFPGPDFSRIFRSRARFRFVPSRLFLMAPEDDTPGFHLLLPLCQPLLLTK